MKFEMPRERASILLVDDERIMRETLTPILVAAGFDVVLASDGRAAVQSFLLERPDLVLLDVMMPVVDGYETCAELRKLDRETPIVFLSALDGEEDQIKGLKLGADDYVSKTASNAMLIARVENALERADCFSKAAAPTAMTKTEADIYRVLDSDRGRFFGYREIFAAICGEGYVADEGAIRVHISHMRKKLPRGEKIESKRRVGFALKS